MNLINQIILSINPISILVLGSFLHSIFLKKKNFEFGILFLNSTTELLLLLFIILKINSINIYNSFFIVHNFLWLYLILNLTYLKKIKLFFLFFFLSFSLINLLLIEKDNLNFYTFIIGALFYILFFIIESYFQLKKENLSYFTDNNYLLLFTPIIFFFGMSFIFGFRNSNIRNIIIFKNTDLYNLIGNFVNVIYYSLINIYIYRERKKQND